MVYFIEALIVIGFLPVFGYVMHILQNIITGVLAKFIGSRKAYIFRNYLTFLGVIQHEFAHALFAFITGAKVTKIVPFNPDKTKLGYIEYSARGSKLLQSIQHCFSASAPVLVGAITILIALTTCQGTNIFVTILVYYYAISVFFHMNMSDADVKAYLRGAPFLYMILVGVFFFFGYFGGYTFITI